jgi:DNA repair exonuclease SbcCD nuclease subunit
MRKWIVTSDFHLASSYPFSTSPNPFRDQFFRKSYTAVKQIIKEAVIQRLDIIHAGDWFDKERIAAPEYSITMATLQALLEDNLHLFLNLGNHEIDYRDGIPSFLWSLAARFDNMHVPKLGAWTHFERNGLHLYLVPYCREAEFNDILEDLSKRDLQKPAALVIHQNIKGIQLAKTVLKQGISGRELVEKLQGSFKFIVCGHLHHPHDFEKLSVPIIIPGSIAAMDFNDEYSEKSFCILTLDDSCDVVSIDRISIKDQISFHTICLQDVGAVKNSTGCFFKIGHTMEETNEYNVAKRELLDRGAIGVTYEIIRSYKNTIASQDRPVSVSIDDWLRLYLEEIGIDTEECEAIAKRNEEIFG